MLRLRECLKRVNKLYKLAKSNNCLFTLDRLDVTTVRDVIQSINKDPNLEVVIYTSDGSRIEMKHSELAKQSIYSLFNGGE